MSQLLIGSHVSMKMPKQFLGSVEQALDFGENTFMIYTGAPQNTRRKPIEELKITEGKALAKKNSISPVVVHAPYVVNLGNTTKPESFEFAVAFLREEVKRAEALGATQIVLHPGAHVGAGEEAAIAQIAKGLNQIIDPDQNVQIALETMAGKGTEVGTSFEQLKAIIDQVDHDEKLSVCFDTCHTSDAGYDIKTDFNGVLDHFDEVIGLNRLKVVHLNDSKNEQGAHKDRHEVIGYGFLGFDVLNEIAHSERLATVPKIMETPFVGPDKKHQYSPHPYEVAMFKAGQFNENLMDDILNQAPIK
ncbi:endonuclease IV [Secundilactobacillus oryzae JCM 18671]|uniref:Probable endonuclease 4 n=1 Tax=Secundilactobacillus oryzae JCM 18671 TaxID=1291743 RepID=A0A081BHC9_9LACO|nr:deoxyribonuclease IV [Secundilactobacillus oryzae]GAK47447.1 endonuclease IV [Secundilactobacillus oryzae JCM 18671]